MIEDNTKPPLDDSEHILGTFDFMHLSTLGKDFINSLYFGSAFVDKACLRLFISRALQIDPLLRPSQIQLGPVMTRWKYVNVRIILLERANYDC
jgi:hypothetical protein